MNILRHSIYLQAMGIDAYVSRRQLPGAATTQRLAIVPSSPVPLPATATPVQMPRIEPASIAAPVVPAGAAPREGRLSPLRFSLAVITCGGWLWLEELEGEVFSAEQLHLVQAMARAMGRLTAGESGDNGEPAALATQFDWPIHNNLQLDQSEDAARSSLAAFIQRRLGENGCRGLVLLGPNSAERVPMDQLDDRRHRRIASTAAMLLDPLLKKQAWRDLRRLAGTQ
ncbi:MAG: hypothetical protein H6984_15045 [Pseudomonadales bacterium]|nr:hypothetical protein [Halioglobus sp.]MCP5123768.1 hypothetical protein [Pseudomonadales bacterium]